MKNRWLSLGIAVIIFVAGYFLNKFINPIGITSVGQATTVMMPPNGVNPQAPAYLPFSFTPKNNESIYTQISFIGYDIAQSVTINNKTYTNQTPPAGGATYIPDGSVGVDKWNQNQVIVITAQINAANYDHFGWNQQYHNGPLVVSYNDAGDQHKALINAIDVLNN